MGKPWIMANCSALVQGTLKIKGLMVGSLESLSLQGKFLIDSEEEEVVKCSRKRGILVRILV